MRQIVLVAALASLLLGTLVTPAFAEISTDTNNGEIRASAKKPGGHRLKKDKDTHKANKNVGIEVRTTRKATSDDTDVSKNSVNTASGERSQKIQASVALYKQQLTTRATCLESAHAERCGAPVVPDFGTVQTVPFEVGGTVPNPGPKAAPRVVVTPEQVAYMAFARLKLTPPRPRIGPAPSRNRWDMAAVGYPLWLWGEGNAHPAPASDSIGGLFVSLDAHVSRIVFNMGDGTRVTCQGVGQKWTKAVAPGQKSPTCGHVYTEPSLPKGEYTVTATTYWSVAWNVTGVTGVIPFVQSATTTLPVGELQVLVR